MDRKGKIEKGKKGDKKKINIWRTTIKHKIGRKGKEEGKRKMVLGKK
jgi:hypothetical protein